MKDGSINKNTSVWLDVMRALAAQAVVFGHLYQLYFFGNHAGPESETASYFHAFIIYVSRYSHDAVIVFFVLSGYLVGGSTVKALRGQYFSWQSFLISRLSRLWTVLLPCLLLTASIDFVSTHYGTGYQILGNWTSMYPTTWLDENPWSAQRFFSNLFFLTRVTAPMFGSNISLWSLMNEFWYYLMLPAGVIFMTGGAKQRIIAATILIVTFAVAINLSHGLLLPFFIGFMIWLMGVVAYLIKPTKSLVISALFAVAACSWMWATRAESEIDTTKDILTGIIITCAIIATRIFPTRHLERISRFMAGYSFSLYTLHLPLIVMLMSLDPATSLNKPFNGGDLLRFMIYVIIVNLGSMSFRVESNTVTGASPARTGWPAGA
ncbi:acyltransferase family protein, partial [Burkholderia vietnamiensis]|uniref:acyltransferase family protein n=1 Tax=Burkholderia vietnamiensis TaxID=60552 RepID=UPI0012DA83B1